jgi:hypothetical protein
LSVDPDVATILAEIRADLAQIKLLASAIPEHGEDIARLGKDVAEIQAWVVKIDELLADYPQRLGRLEKKQESDDQDRQDDEAATRRGAGSATDDAHRGMARGEARELDDALEARTDVKITDLKGRVGEIRDSFVTLASVVRENQSATLALLVVAALIGGALLFILSQAVGL